MGYAKGLLLRIYMVVVTILLLQCILFPINQIVWLSSTLVLTSSSFQKTSVDVHCPGPWLKFLIMGLKTVLKMGCPMRRAISQEAAPFKHEQKKKNLVDGFGRWQ